MAGQRLENENGLVLTSSLYLHTGMEWKPQGKRITKGPLSPPSPMPPIPHCLAVWGQVAGTAAWMQSSRLSLLLHIQGNRGSRCPPPTEAEGLYLLEDDVNVTCNQLRDLLPFSGLYRIVALLVLPKILREDTALFASRLGCPVWETFLWLHSHHHELPG